MLLPNSSGKSCSRSCIFENRISFTNRGIVTTAGGIFLFCWFTHSFQGRYMYTIRSIMRNSTFTQLQNINFFFGKLDRSYIIIKQDDQRLFLKYSNMKKLLYFKMFKIIPQEENRLTSWTKPFSSYASTSPRKPPSSLCIFSLSDTSKRNFLLSNLKIVYNCK